MHTVAEASTVSPTSANGGSPGSGERQKMPGDGDTTTWAPGGGRVDGTKPDALLDG